MTRVMIMGADGYLGFPLAMKLAADKNKNYEVSGSDNFSRRKNVRLAGSDSAIPILDMERRLDSFEKQTGEKITFYEGDLTEPSFTNLIIKKEKPHVIVHLGEIPSAPYSMIDLEHCNHTQMNNIISTNNILFAMKKYAANRCHLLKLGTLGEAGTPNIDIEEGFIKIEHKGRVDTLPFPRQPGSFYHLSKVHDSHNIAFACKIWGLRSTDIMQGVVYGSTTEEIEKYQLNTRYDFDAIWGTCLNRFCTQAVTGHPLTVYGTGGQTRGYIALRDSLQCMKIAIDNPPAKGEYRVFNQYDEYYSVNELAEMVKSISRGFGLSPEIEHLENPRVEAEEHYYNPVNDKLKALGFKPTLSIGDEIALTLPKLMQNHDIIKKYIDAIRPDVQWREAN